MPRLSSSRYLATRRSLITDWRRRIPVLSHLPYAQQLTLHDYFAFALELEDVETLAHRKAATAADPSFPHRAGKIIKRFEILSSIDRSVAPVPIGQVRSTHKVAHALARPELDLEKIAASMLDRIMCEIKEEQEAA